MRLAFFSAMHSFPQRAANESGPGFAQGRRVPVPPVGEWHSHAHTPSEPPVVVATC